MTDVYPLKFRVDLERRLRRRGVEIILDDTIEGQPRLEPDVPLKTRKGTSLKCDLLVSSPISPSQIHSNHAETGR